MKISFEFQVSSLGAVAWFKVQGRKSKVQSLSSDSLSFQFSRFEFEVLHLSVFQFWNLESRIWNLEV